MMNHLLSVIVIAGLLGTFVFASAPEPREGASRPTPASARGIAGASSTAASPAVLLAASPSSTAMSTLSSQQPPIPLMRAQRVSTAKVPSVEAKAHETEVQTPDVAGRAGAKTAIEADGYKGVTVLSKGADGTWRAKAYRGNTEVQLTVDGTGRVATQ